MEYSKHLRVKGKGKHFSHPQNEVSDNLLPFLKSEENELFCVNKPNFFVHTFNLNLNSSFVKSFLSFSNFFTWSTKSQN